MSANKTNLETHLFELNGRKYVQLYLYAVPLNETFIHKGIKYRKINNNEEFNVIEMKRNKKTTLGLHYGCLVSENKSKSYRINAEDYRKERLSDYKTFRIVA